MGVPNQIGVIREDLGPYEGFDFMSEDGGSREQTRPKPGAAIRHIEDQNLQGPYIAAYQDYGSMKRKIVKSARKWCASTNKPKKFKLSANTNQNTPPNSIFVFGNVSQGRTGANAPSPAPQGTTNHQGPNGNLAQRQKLQAADLVLGNLRLKPKILKTLTTGDVLPRIVAIRLKLQKGQRRMNCVTKN